MKHPAAAIIALLIAINITAQTDTTTVSDEELFRWLDTYGTTTASDSTTTTNTADTTAANTDTIPRPDTQPADTTINVNALITNAFSKSKKRNDKTTSKTTETKKQPTKRTTKKTQPDKTPRPIIPDIPLEKAQLITAEDSTITHREALATAASNPLFLDWVACAPPHKTKDLFDQDSTITALRNSSSKYISRTTPELFDYHISQLPKSSEIKSKKLKSADAKKLALQTKEYLKVSKNATIQLEGYQKPKWTAGAKFQVQASQSYISKNWYKGGESNLAANIYAMGYCNYNNHANMQWDNKIEWKLGLNSTISDSLRMIGVNDDLLRINSKFGVKAFKSFFYTAEYDFQTTLFNSYRPQSYVRSSGPFSPVRMNFSLGIDYKYKEKLSVFISPLSYKLVYVSDTTYHPSVDPSESIPHIIGITDGKRSLNQLGALLRIGWQHKFNNSIEMEVKFSFFGNYVGVKKGIETDLEVIGNFQINRFLSAKVSLNPRFDSTVPPADGGKPKLQFRELISLGFNYVI